MASGVGWLLENHPWHAMLNEHHMTYVVMATAVIAAVLSISLLAFPLATERALARFPRNRSSGSLLAAIALIWSSLLVNNMTLGELGQYKWLLFVLAPIAFFLVTRYLDELLASRALGGLMMLYPTLLVDSARWHSSAWRYVPVVLAYVMVIAGIWLVLSPYKFRIWVTAAVGSPPRRRTCGLFFASLALALLAAGVLSD